MKKFDKGFNIGQVGCLDILEHLAFAESIAEAYKVNMKAKHTYF